MKKVFAVLLLVCISTFGIECKGDYLALVSQLDKNTTLGDLDSSISCNNATTNINFAVKPQQADTNSSSFVSTNLLLQGFYTNYANWISIENNHILVADFNANFKVGHSEWSVGYAKSTQGNRNGGNEYGDLLLRVVPQLSDFFKVKLGFGYRQLNFKTIATVRDGDNYVYGYEGGWRKLQQYEKLSMNTYLRRYFIEMPLKDIINTPLDPKAKVGLSYEQNTIPFAASYIGKFDNKYGALYTQARQKRYGISLGYDKKIEELKDWWGLKSYHVALNVTQMRPTSDYEIQAQWRFGSVTNWWPEFSYRFEPYLKIATFGKNGNFFLSAPVESFAIPITEKRWTIKDIYVNELIWGIKTNFLYRF